jgi:3-oxoacyl-[acyl-carrier protein] reductase
MQKPGFEDLEDKRVLVTGASTGIGAAVARGFAACGAEVGVHYGRNRAEAEAVVAALRAGGGRARAFGADLTDPGARENLVNEVLDRFGGLDILVNNAGSIGGRVPFGEVADAFRDDLFALNVIAVADLVKRFLPALRASGSGAVINTSSVAVRTGGGVGTVTYAATKGALASMAIGLAKELGPMGIRVNSVAPGVIVTPLHRITPDEQLETVRRATPLGRLGTPEDCVGAYLFLASPSLSGYVNGAVIEVGGGR